mgnify:CR=1 FL=1
MCNIKNHPTLSYRLINNVTGWVAFVVASITYILTVEPTASLWDCGEFITTSVGLQVGAHGQLLGLQRVYRDVVQARGRTPSRSASIHDYLTTIRHIRTKSRNPILHDQHHVGSMFRVHDLVPVLDDHAFG